ncbi:polysaccharide biosynthesis protein [Sphingobacterium sp. HJSM2_6]|uniref:polysaccharide biosynthesis protein n=1 Tax=Sphingobacterium sp. HJSM2_6 TaxID=3366264 RepID=UPI003BEE8A7F
MKNLILSDKIKSKWLILFIDLIIIICTLLFSFVISIDKTLKELMNLEACLFIGFYCITSIGVFIFLKINTGVIRYSNTEDMLKIFVAVFTVNLIVVSIYKVTTEWGAVQLNGLEKMLILNFFISSSLLVFLRALVKYVYISTKNLSEIKKENILIYGSDHHALLIKKTLEMDEVSILNIIGFIDNDIDRSNKYIEQKKVYPFPSLVFLRDKYKIKKILIPENYLNDSNKIKILEICTKAEIPLIKVPTSDKWLYGKLDNDQLKNLNIDDLLGREPIKLDKDNIFKELKDKKVLITGAAGSIGSEIVRQVLNYYPKMVILYDQAETPLHDLKLSLEDNLRADSIKIFIGNIQNSERIRALFEQYQPDFVFHAAAYKHVPMMEDNPSEAILTNVLGTKNLADICVEYNVEKFVMISTDKAVKPTNVMGASKRLAEIYIQSLNSIINYTDKKTCFITTRFGNVLGSSGSVIPRFRNQIERRVPITVTHPDITRYFMTIPEAVELVLEAGAMGKGGEIFLFDMGEPIKILDLALNMIKLAGLKPYVDIDVVFTGLRPGEKIYEELLLLEEKIIQTHHPKIKISQNVEYNYFQFKKNIEHLLEINKKGKDYNVVKKMKEILPDFISNNSKFTALDLLEVN